MAERLDFRKLRYVVTVAQVQSMTAAAKILSITQPALTRCINEVEEDLGIQIFLRLPRGVAVTDAGERFITRARILINDLEALGNDFQYGATETRRKLRIGGAPGAYLYLAGTSLAHFAETNTDVDIITSEGLPQDVFPRLETGELDAVVSTSAHMGRWPDIPAEHLAPLQFAYMVRKGHPLERLKPFTIEETLQYPMILPATSDWLRLDLAELHHAEGLPPVKPSYVSDNFNFIFALLEKTDAYLPMITPPKELERLSKQFSMVGVRRPSSKNFLCVAYSKTRAVSPLVHDFISMTKKTLKE